MNKKIYRKLSWSIVGNLLFAFVTWVIIIVITKMLGNEILGRYSFAIAVTGPIFMLSNLQLRVLYATDIERKNEDNSYFSLRNISFLFSAIVLIFVLKIKNITDVDYIYLFINVYTFKLLQSLSDVIYGKYQLENSVQDVGKSQTLKSIGIISSFMTSMLFFKSINISLLFSNVIFIFIISIYDKRLLKRYNNKIRLFGISTFSFKNIMINGIPLGIVMMLISLNTNIPRYFIENNIGIEQLGIFSAIVFFLVAGNLFTTSIGQTLITPLSKYYSEKKYEDFNKTVIKLVLFAIGIGLFGIIVSYFLGIYILELVYTPEYVIYNDLFVLLMVAGLFSYISSFLGYTISAMRLFNIQVFIFSIIVSITFIACYYLIPLFGLYGAAYSLIIASVANVFLLAIIIKLKFIKR